MPYRWNKRFRFLEFSARVLIIEFRAVAQINQRRQTQLLYKTLFSNKRQNQIYDFSHEIRKKSKFPFVQNLLNSLIEVWLQFAMKIPLIRWVNSKSVFLNIWMYFVWGVELKSLPSRDLCGALKSEASYFSKKIKVGFVQFFSYTNHTKVQKLNFN